MKKHRQPLTSAALCARANGYSVVQPQLTHARFECIPHAQQVS